MKQVNNKKMAKNTSTIGKTFSDDELTAMRERAKELREEKRLNKNKAEGEKAVLSKIAEMLEPDRSMAKRIHAIVKEAAPTLSPKTWYGMPAYANQEGKLICYFTAASKFKTRYATFGFNDDANLDDGNMWPTSFALTKLTAAVEGKIASLVKKSSQGGKQAVKRI